LGTPAIRSGTFHTRLKYSIVKPLFKEGDRENMASYRPISLLNTFSKVLEKIFYERLLQHINVEILNRLNERRVIGGFFCDLQNVFALTIISY
jgi:hypothetical protein